MILNILVGGPKEQWPDELVAGNIRGPWIGVDRGALRLVQLGITPELSIGDFDSMTESEFKLVTQHSRHTKTANPEKDDTDTELALREAIANFTFDTVMIYGATGGRIDHLLANLFFIFREPFNTMFEKICLVDKQNSIRFFKPGSYHLVKEDGKKYLAFIPLTQVTHLSLIDEKYTLNKTDFLYPVSLASNEFVGDTGEFSFKSGVVAVIQSRDDEK
ncbi:thiamine pyrophosphokinase [Dellaglioa algida]|nr:thiamine pyrophosphokinase [Dellaglioa algida]